MADHVDDPKSPPQEYKLWWRHSGMSEIDVGDKWPMTNLYTWNQLLQDTEGHSVTHLKIDRHIPINICDHQFPHLTHLSVTGIPLNSLPTLQSFLKLVPLEVLQCSGFRFLDGLPEFPSSLKSLQITRCTLGKLQKDSLSHLIALEKLDLSRTLLPSADDVILNGLSELRTLLLSECELSSIPQSICHLEKLERLDLSSNSLTTGSVLGSGPKTLRELNLSNCKLAQVDESILSLESLEILNLSNNYFTVLPEKIQAMETLHELYLDKCQLTGLPSGLAKLKQLKVLNLTSNPLSTTSTVNLLDSLTSLTVLYLSSCQLGAVPRLSNLCRLENLNLSNNEFTGGIPADVCIPSLKQLNLANCHITELPKSIAQLNVLETLDLSRNDFSKDFPDVIVSLKSLIELNLSFCGLDKLPASISGLARLQYLFLRENALVYLPTDIRDLKFLKVIGLAGNYQLQSLGEGVEFLPNLEAIDVDGCTSLKLPLYPICEQGIVSIKQYYEDLSKRGVRSNLLPLIAVMGAGLSGKTSLIDSLEEGKRKYTLRVEGKLNEEATKVFQFREIQEDGVKLRFIDFGGQEIYQATYRLSLRENCIPVVVLNLEEYDGISKSKGPGEAVKRLFFDWIAHLHLHLPNLDKPMLILSHSDYFTKKASENAKALEDAADLEDAEAFQDSDTSEDSKALDDAIKELKENIRIVRNELASEAVQVKDRHSAYQIPKNFSNTQEEYVDPNEIFVIGTKYGKAFHDIKYKLQQKCLNAATDVIPRQWDQVGKAVKKLTACVYQRNEISEEIGDGLSEQQLDTILQYMHRCGQLLWYENVRELQNDIFPNTGKVTELLTILYDHEHSAKWKQRIEEFKPFLNEENRMVEEKEYKKSVEVFQKTGMLRSTVLHHLIAKESEFKQEQDMEIAIKALRSFKLLFGPIHRNGMAHYIFPSFSDVNDRIGHRSCVDKEVHLEVAVTFLGLPFPEFVYHQMTVALLEVNAGVEEKLVVKRDGAVIQFKNSVICFTHNYMSKAALIKVFCNTSYIKEAWDMLLDVLGNIFQHTLRTWPATVYSCKVTCPHCIIVGNEDPKKDQNPEWCRLDVKPGEIHYHNPLKPIVCGSNRTVPAALKFPCAELTNVEIQKLEGYISKHRKRPSYAEVDASTLSPDEEDGDDDDNDDNDNYFLPKENSAASMESYRLKATSLSCRKKFSDYSQVYEVSPRRGRMLIINNNEFDRRPLLNRTGSDVDVQNLSTLFKRLKFEVNEKQNLTAMDMLLTVSEETRHPGHKNSFVLIIMSHKTARGAIYGKDMKAIQLEDICELLSDKNFRRMANKPKVVIIQGCSGDERDFGDLAGRSLPTTSQIQDAKEGKSEKKLINCARVGGDMIIAQSSMDSYRSMRHPQFGSPFIRCLVAMFYKHSCDTDVETLLKMVQEKVISLSIELADDKYVFPQIPVVESTTSHNRKFYLFPRYNDETNLTP